MWCAPMGLGGEASSDVEFALRPMRSRKSRTVVSDCGPNVYLVFLYRERIWASMAPDENLARVSDYVLRVWRRFSP